MALTTYTELQSAVASYLARADLTSYIPDFITLAETRLGREVRLRKQWTRVTSSTASGDDTISLPSDFLDMKSIFITGSPNKVLRFLTPAQFPEIYASTTTGKPIAYSVMGSEMRLTPTPDAVYTVEMLYVAKPAALSSAAPSNTWLANAPDLYLYATLLEAEPFLMNDARVALWAQLYDRALSALRLSEERAQSPGVPLTMRVL